MHQVLPAPCTVHQTCACFGGVVVDVLAWTRSPQLHVHSYSLQNVSPKIVTMHGTSSSHEILTLFTGNCEEFGMNEVNTHTIQFYNSVLRSTFTAAWRPKEF